MRRIPSIFDVENDFEGLAEKSGHTNVSVGTP